MKAAAIQMVSGVSLDANLDAARALLRDAAAQGAELAVLLDRPIHLYLHVKVKEGWDEDRSVYRDLGLDWVE